MARTLTNVASSVASEAAKHQRLASGDPVSQDYEHHFYVFAVASVDKVQERTREKLMTGTLMNVKEDSDDDV